MPEISTITATKSDFFVKRGNTLNPVTLQFFTSLLGVETAINITTSTFLLTVKKANGQIVLSFSLGSGLTIQNTNELVISKSASSMNITEGTYLYSLEMTKLSGIVSTEIYGNFIVE